MTDFLPLALLALAASLVPLISVRLIAERWMDRARDQWLHALAWLTAVVLLAHEPAFGLIVAAVLLHWRTHEQLPAVLTWAGISATWLLVQAIPATWQDAIPWGWRAVAIGQVAFGIAQRRHKFEVKGTLGQRTMLGAYLALVLPFASPCEWPVYAVGLWLTSSWVALLAAVVGLAIHYPTATAYAAPAVLVVGALEAIPWTRRHLIDRTPRGGSLDGLRARWDTATAVVRLAVRGSIWWRGRGPGGRAAMDRPRDDILRASVVTGRYLLTTPFHNEPLELWYTYGLLGLAAMIVLTWRLAPHLALGDPWTACVVAGAVLSLGTIPTRVVPVGLTWLIAMAVVGGRTHG